jgi:hypothetical protein
MAGLLAKAEVLRGYIADVRMVRYVHSDGQSSIVDASGSRQHDAEQLAWIHCRSRSRLSLQQRKEGHTSVSL